MTFENYKMEIVYASQSDMISNATNLLEVLHEVNYRMSGIFEDHEGCTMMGLEIVLIHGYLTLVTFRHVGEKCSRFNFDPLMNFLSIIQKLNFFKKSNRKTGNFENITRWTDGICVWFTHINKYKLFLHFFQNIKCI